MKNYLLLFRLFIFINLLHTITSRNCHVIINQNYVIHVVNNLPPKSAPLTVHCASGDNDLGTHTLSVNQAFTWGFCESFVSQTLFFCHLWWGSKDIAFNVFTPELSKRCDEHCYWAAKSDGIYFSGSYPPGKLEKKYDW